MNLPEFFLTYPLDYAADLDRCLTNQLICMINLT